MTDTVFQLRTSYPDHDSEGSHLRVTERGQIEIFEHSYLHDAEERAGIWLNAEQWAELAEFAARMSQQEIASSSNNVIHLNNEQVLEAQAAVREERRQKLMADAREFMTTPELVRLHDGWFALHGAYREGIELLHDAGEVEYDTSNKHTRARYIGKQV